MKRLFRPTVVVVVAALLAGVSGMMLSVVAFGQTGTAVDPTADYTTTTPTVTEPLSSYTTPEAATPTPTTTTPSSETPTSTGASTPQGGSSASTVNGGKETPASSAGPIPSRVTRSGPTHLAFTGAEPLIVGGAGLALMLAGLTLQVRRRRSRVP